MKWSKLKQRIEEGFADCARGRIEVWNTRYRHSHDSEGEGWITFDKERVHSMGTLTFLNEWYSQSKALQSARDCEDRTDSTKTYTYRTAQDEVKTKLLNEGTLSLEDFYNALFEYLNLSMEQILTSDKTIVRALGMFDRRLGKRRLSVLNVDDEQDLVRQFYDLRRALEGLPPSALK